MLHSPQFAVGAFLQERSWPYVARFDKARVLLAAGYIGAHDEDSREGRSLGAAFVRFLWQALDAAPEADPAEVDELIRGAAASAIAKSDMSLQLHIGMTLGLRRSKATWWFYNRGGATVIGCLGGHVERLIVPDTLYEDLVSQGVDVSSLDDDDITRDIQTRLLSVPRRDPGRLPYRSVDLAPGDWVAAVTDCRVADALLEGTPPATALNLHHELAPNELIVRTHFFIRRWR